RFSRDWSSDVCSSDLYHIVTKDTIDEEILAALREKKTISQLVADFGRRFTKMGKKEKSKLEEKLQRLKDELERQYGEHLIDEDRSEERRVGKGARCRG